MLKFCLIIYILIHITSCGGNKIINVEDLLEDSINKPMISLLIPNIGSVGDEIQITGNFFEGIVQNMKVSFGDVGSSIKSASKNNLFVFVPENEGIVEVLVKVKDMYSNVMKFTYKETRDKWKILSTGIFAPLEVNEVSTFIGESQIRLKNGNIFAVLGSNAAISKDNGKTWNTTTKIVDIQKYGITAPACIESRNGVIIIAFMNSKEKRWNWNNNLFDAPEATLPTYVVRSEDGGKTWLEPHKLHEDWTGAIRSIIETKDGSIVFTTMKLLHNPGRHAVLTYSSKDNGATWKPSNILDNPDSKGHHSGLMESTVIQLNDGCLWQLIRTNWDYIYESYSYDDGLTWDKPKKTEIEASSSPHSIIRLKSGRLVLVWNRLYPDGLTETPRFGGNKNPNLSEVAASWMRHQLSIMFSDDEGKTWSAPRVIAKYNDYVQPENNYDMNKWISYPYVVELDTGILFITTGFGGLRIKLKEADFL